MQHLLDKNGFKYCGIVYVEDGTERIAYQKVVNNTKIHKSKEQRHLILMSLLLVAICLTESCCEGRFFSTCIEM